MPSTTPRRASHRGSAKSTPTRPKSVDIGTPLGLYDTNSVREKVRLWQQQGGGVITTSETVVEDVDENPPSEIKSEKAPEPPRAVTRPKVDHHTSTADTKTRNSPKKRVISDQHWRKERSPPRAPLASASPPKRITVYETNDHFVPSGGGKRGPKKEEGSCTTSSSGIADDGIRVYATPSPSRKHSKAKQVVKDDDSNDESSITKHGPRRMPSVSASSTSSTSTKKAPDRQQNASQSEETIGMRRTTPPPKDDDDWATSEADFSELSRRRARRGYQTSRGNGRGHKGGILGHVGHVLDESKKIFTKPAPPPPPVPPTNRGDKIEAWLSATPSQFMDDDVSSVEIPAPLNTRSKRTQMPQEEGQRDKSDISNEKAFHQRKSVDNDTRRRYSGDSSVISGDRKPSRESPHTLEGQKPHYDDRKRPTATLLAHSTKPGIHKTTKLSEAEQSRTTAPPSEIDVRHSQSSGRETSAFSDGSEVSATELPFPVKLRRPFPSTGVHRLSTIVSVETLTTQDESMSHDPKFQGLSRNRPSAKSIQTLSSIEPEEQDSFDPNSLSVASSGLKRRLTKHADLMSVLSDPQAGCKSVRSVRSIRTNRSRLARATLGDVLHELSLDETKYMRELRTLVGGVIPVLLTCVLSRSDSAIAAGLFRPSLDPKDGTKFTKPIVDMGTALERLKTLHKRIPVDDSDALLNWAQGAQRVYRDYLKAWKLGFQDVVVNLAPSEETDDTTSDTLSLDQGMARDDNGDVVDGDGEKVDVAYLLKRPLVRLKYLEKTFKGINILKHSPKTEEIMTIYQTLVVEARRRSHEERERLEDESAASIDATRARDPASLAVLSDVSIDRSRRVLARDIFNLSLHHSSGQLVDCRAELLLRDNLPTNGSGDLLICEVDNTGRWLLFPPIMSGCFSARGDNAEGELVIMIRNGSDEHQKWQELLSLKIDDEEVAKEWIRLLGQDPVPPPICRTRSFVDRLRGLQSENIDEKSSIAAPLSDDGYSRNSIEIDIPIGEKASLLSRTTKSSVTRDGQSSNRSIFSSSLTRTSRDSAHSVITRHSDITPATSQSSPKTPRADSPSISDLDNRRQTPEDQSPTGLKRVKAKRRSRHAAEMSPSSTPPRGSLTPERDIPSPLSLRNADRDLIDPKISTQMKAAQLKERPSKDSTFAGIQMRSTAHHRVSSVPSLDLPTIRKIRKSSPASTLADSDDHLSRDISNPDDPTEWKNVSLHESKEAIPDHSEVAPAPPPHRSPSPANLKLQGVPILSPSTVQLKRRSSSPLKHEYEPSSASESSSDSDTSTVRHYDMDSSSSDSSDEELEDEDDELSRRPSRSQAGQGTKNSTPELPPNFNGETLSSPNPESQTPYRTIPSQSSRPSKAIASIFSWSIKGTWESLFPDECSIVVTPGLIEAYEITTTFPQSPPRSSGHAGAGVPSVRPLVALELTPLVPIRRGTAIDISIRSPPTERSRITSSNNFMFRSRNTDDCEALYALINYARINNPTYIALQNARGPYSGPPAALGRHNSTQSNKGSGWLGFPRRKNSYRASSARTPSVAMASESSVGTMSSAFSALKWFGAGSKMFGMARSTATSRTGSRDDSLFSSSLGSPGQFAGIVEAAKGADGIGLSNAKIRLYVRESVSKWRDMGAARLTIMPASPKPSRPGTATSAEGEHLTQEDAGEAVEATETPAPPRREATQEKRILIRGKTYDEVLLDVCLGESSFERVARTGIAVSVWEGSEGGTVGKQGGVIAGSFKVYMIQMKSEAEAAYTFGMVGKLRY